MKKIFILTGEPSGDKLASKVINELKKSLKSFLSSAFSYASTNQGRLVLIFIRSGLLLPISDGSWRGLIAYFGVFNPHVYIDGILE